MVWTLSRSVTWLDHKNQKGKTMRPSFLTSAVLILSAFVVGCCPVRGSNWSDNLKIIPKPVSLKVGKGSLAITPQTAIIVNSDAEKALKAGEYLAEKIKTATGLGLTVQKASGSGQGAGAILLSTTKADKKLGDEGYSLTVDKKGIVITANQAAGLFYGVQSLLQLLPTGPFDSSKTGQSTDVSLPYVKIKDQPRYSWRGMHLDVCRHFFPKEFIKKYIDLIAMHKMNVFHVHLTDDQGWRVEIKRYPKLTEIGAWRVDREDKHWNEREDQRPGEKATYGGFYTQDDIREIVAYAAERFITVVPEIEMPGHSTAAVASYPECSCTGGPFTVKPGGLWPIRDVFCPGNEQTFAFLEGVLTEVIDLFPSKYIHIGADEVDKSRWQACPKCQARIKSEGLKNEEELQSYFVKRIEKFIISKNRKLIGWDEILEGGLAPEATVMSWRGTQGGIEAAHQGHDVVMSPTSHCYFDYYQSDPTGEPLAIGGFLPMEKVYEFEPTPAELRVKAARHVLGAQANVWTEYIPTPEHAEYMAAPRMCALAEVVWSSKKHRNWNDFLARLSNHYLRLDAMDIHYRQPDLFPAGAKFVFMDRMNVEITKPRPYSEVRYTLDSTAPSSESTLYTQPFLVTETTTVTAQEFLPNGKIGQVQRALYEKQQPRKSDTVTNLKRGLRYRYFVLDRELSSTSELDTLQPAQSGVAAKFEFPFKETAELFGLELDGFIDIRKDDVYTFTTSSNDGSRLFIGDVVVVDNDGGHGAIEKSGQIALAKGHHPIKLRYFQAGGEKALQVFMEGPGMEKRAIKSGMLSRIED